MLVDDSYLVIDPVSRKLNVEEVAKRLRRIRKAASWIPKSWKLYIVSDGSSVIDPFQDPCSQGLDNKTLRNLSFGRQLNRRWSVIFNGLNARMRIAVVDVLDSRSVEQKQRRLQTTNSASSIWSTHILRFEEGSGPCTMRYHETHGKTWRTSHKRGPVSQCSRGSRIH